MNIKLQQVYRPSQYASPFDVDTPGFNQGWWRIGPSSYRDSNCDWFILTKDHEEIARVEVNHTRLIRSEDYRSWPQDQYVAEITFIEVREDLTRRDFGTRLVNELALRYPRQVLVANPLNSEGFWERLGWQRYESVGSERHEPPLYTQHAEHVASS